MTASGEVEESRVTTEAPEDPEEGWPTELAEHCKLTGLVHAMERCDAALPGTGTAAVGAVATLWRMGAPAQELGVLADDLEAAADEAARAGDKAPLRFIELVEGLVEQHTARVGYRIGMAKMRERIDATAELWPPESRDAEEAAEDAPA